MGGRVRCVIAAGLLEGRRNDRTPCCANCKHCPCCTNNSWPDRFARAEGGSEGCSRCGRVPGALVEGLELKDLADAGKLYAATQTDAFGDLQRGETTKGPSDCVEWTQLHADGFEPTSTVEAQADSASKLHCMTLLLLQRAQPSKVSYVRDLAWDRSLLSLLPAVVATAFSKERENAVAAATSKGLSLAQFDRKATVKPSPEEHTVEDRRRGWADHDPCARRSLGRLERRRG